MGMILSRLREASTWRGIILLLTSLGVLVEPSAAAFTLPAGVGLSGLAGILLGDRVKLPPAVEAKAQEIEAELEETRMGGRL